MAKQFRTAAAFKASLESHLRARAEVRGVPFQTLQLKFVIERLLARLFREENPPWLLKGGFAMDLRFRPQARTTKDVDLSVTRAAERAGPVSVAMQNLLQAAVDVDLEDYLTFRIGAPKKELTNAPKGGGRYPCEALLVGKTYAKFHVDVGIGDAVVGSPERLTGDDVLEFAGIEPASVLAIPKSQQFAENSTPTPSLGPGASTPGPRISWILCFWSSVGYRMWGRFKRRLQPRSRHEVRMNYQPR